MGFHFAQVVAKSGEGVIVGSKSEAGKNRLMGSGSIPLWGARSLPKERSPATATVTDLVFGSRITCAALEA